MPANLDPTGRHATARGALSAARRLRGAARDRLESARGEDGFLLVEVLVSALLVALIVVGTFNGFDVAQRFSTAERQHEQAALIAAASQEQLRSEPASVLATLKINPHTYTQTVQGTLYTVKQTAELQPAAKAAAAACNSNRQAGNAYRITSTVSWHLQEETKRPPVSASSLITPPIGSSLEVDVLSSPGVTTGVAGVTVNIKYKPQGSSGTASQTQTTGSEGCVLFGAVPSLEAEVEVAELLGYVTVDGKPQVLNKTVTLAPNYTVHDTVVYNRAGAIQANFAYNGGATANHKNNEETAEVAQTVTGDTFVAANNLMEVEPNFELGSTSFGAKTSIPFEPKTSTYAASATSKTNLFPFSEEENGYWAVYAGDCTANNPETVTAGAIKPQEKVIVKPGATTAVSVPTSYTTLNVYAEKESVVNGLSHRWEGLETTNAYPVLIDNLGCTGITPNDETEASYKHTQTTTTGSSMGGHLSNPFQPFGKEFTLCLSSTAKNQTYKVKYGNTALSGGVLSIYLKQRPFATISAERVTKEGLYKTEEAAYKAAETKYKEREVQYKEKEKLYKEKEAYKEQNVVAATKKTAYENKKKEAETKKKEYETKKTAYENKKKEYETAKKEYETAKKKYEETKKKYEENKKKYEETKKASYKTEYEKYEKEYKTFEGEYKARETEYKTDESGYKTAETEYKTLETAYKTAETEYKTLETEYKTAETHYEEWAKPHAEYVTFLAEYNTFKTEYVEDYAEYKLAKEAYETAKAEEKEGTSVQVEPGTTCT
jgi:Tfp pilus assembly protein PilV